MSLPRRISVSGVLSSRYDAGSKPLSWDDRVSGVDVVKDSEGNEIRLFCQGDQSTPDVGWELLLTSESEPKVYTWTLYGISSQEP